MTGCGTGVVLICQYSGGVINGCRLFIDVPFGRRSFPLSSKIVLPWVLYDPVSSSDLLQPILVMKASENRRRSDLIPRRKAMSLFFEWRRLAWPRLWEPRS